VADNSYPTSAIVDRLDRIANLLALGYVREFDQPERIRVLNAVGYSAAEIGSFLDLKPNTVSATLYRQRQAKKPKRQRRARTK
jgi:hypothetical protein